jgi:hypothetical protein
LAAVWLMASVPLGSSPLKRLDVDAGTPQAAGRLLQSSL